MTMNVQNRLLSTCIKLRSAADSTNMQSYSAIPGPRPAPFIGNLWRYLPLIGNYKPDTLYENAQLNQKLYGCIVRENLTKNHSILHLFDPLDIETFVRQDGKFPHRRSHRALLKYRADRPKLYLDGGLFPENGNNWYRQRNQFQQRLLSKSQVCANILKLDKTSLNLVSQIDSDMRANGDIVKNFDDLLYKWALGNSLSIFLDLDLDSLEDKQVQQLIQELHNSLIATDGTELKSNKWIKHPSDCSYYRMLVQSQEVLYDFVSKQVEQNKLKCYSKEESYLSQWLNADRLKQQDVISFVIDALMAGLHTTSYTLAFLLYHLACNKSIQDSLRSDINTRIPGSEPVRIDQIDNLNLLRNCLKETMRLNPVSIGTGRLITQNDLVIRNYKIPPGVMIITQNQVISRNEGIFDEANEFKPERWSQYRACPVDQKPSPFATLPFGFGARSCIGQRLAELQIKVVLARLLQRYEIVSFPDSIPVKTTLIHNLGGHFSVQFKRL